MRRQGVVAVLREKSSISSTLSSDAVTDSVDLAAGIVDLGHVHAHLGCR